MKKQMYIQIKDRILPYPKSNTKSDLLDENQIINIERQKDNNQSMQMTIFDFIEV